MRSLYHLILLFHPRAFRRRFGSEMMCIFEEQLRVEPTIGLVVDGLFSLARQWMARANFWLVWMVLLLAGAQIWWIAGVLQKASATKFTVAPAIDVHEIIILTLTSVCLLAVMIIGVTTWAMYCHRRRAAGTKGR